MVISGWAGRTVNIYLRGPIGEFGPHPGGVIIELKIGEESCIGQVGSDGGREMRSHHVIALLHTNQLLLDGSSEGKKSVLL